MTDSAREYRDAMLGRWIEQQCRSMPRAALVAVVLFLFLLLVERLANAACFQSDVRQLCCPAACAAKNSPHWYQADSILRGCMRGMGCQGSETATVGMRCGCQ